jgi:hypothetical protein
MGLLIFRVFFNIKTPNHIQSRRVMALSQDIGLALGFMINPTERLIHLKYMVHKSLLPNHIWRLEFMKISIAEEVFKQLKYQQKRKKIKAL